MFAPIITANAHCLGNSCSVDILNGGECSIQLSENQSGDRVELLNIWRHGGHGNFLSSLPAILSDRAIFHKRAYRSFLCRRPIKMSPACQLEMTLPGGFPVFQGRQG